MSAQAVISAIALLCVGLGAYFVGFEPIQAAGVAIMAGGVSYLLRGDRP